MFGGVDWHGDHRQEAVRRQQLEREKSDLEYQLQLDREQLEREERRNQEIRRDFESERESFRNEIAEYRQQLGEHQSSARDFFAFLEEKKLVQKFDAWVQQKKQQPQEGTADEN